MPPHLGPVLVVWGNFDEPSGSPTMRAFAEVDDVERGGLVVRHQDALAVADRRDAGWLDPDVHPAVSQERGREGGRFQPVVVGLGGRGKQPGEPQGDGGRLERAGRMASHRCQLLGGPGDGGTHQRSLRSLGPGRPR